MVSTTTDPVTLEENFTSVNDLIKSLCEVRGTEYVIFSNRRPGRNIRCMYGRIFNRNTGRIRSVYDANTAVYDCKSPTWITEKYGTDTTASTCKIQCMNDRFRPDYIYLRGTVSYHWGVCL